MTLAALRALIGTVLIDGSHSSENGVSHFAGAVPSHPRQGATASSINAVGRNSGSYVDTNGTGGAGFLRSLFDLRKVDKNDYRDAEANWRGGGPVNVNFTPLTEDQLGGKLWIEATG